MIIDPVIYAQNEYGQAFADIVSGYAADGLGLHPTAKILHVHPLGLQHYARRNRIQFSSSHRTEQKPETMRQRLSTTIRQTRSPRYCFQGIELTPSEWAEQTGIPAGTISKRIRRGWSTDRALTIKPCSPRRNP